MVSALFLSALAWPAAAQFGGSTRPWVSLPAEPARSVILEHCTSCHGIDDYAFHAMSRIEWEAFLDEKHRDLKFGKAPAIAGRDKEVLLDYLAENFGADSIAFPRDYVPREITEFFTDADGRFLLEQRCTACHGVDTTVLSQRHTPEGWRALLVAERERTRVQDASGAGGTRRGGGLSDEELEKLAEWLGRVRGTNPFE